MNINEKKIGITFKDSKEYPIHRWYPYVEGFSAPWIRDRILKFQRNGMLIYDPFGGSGTTQLESSLLGIKSYYSEINPFMRFILETKINVVKDICKDKDTYLREFNSVIYFVNSDMFDTKSKSIEFSDEDKIFLSRDYFEINDLKKLKCILNYLDEIDASDNCRSIVLLAVASIAVDSSNMTRRADLRRRREGEYKDRVVDVAKMFINKINDIIADINSIHSDLEYTTMVSNNAKEFNDKYSNKFDLVITSPPYINGTNYIRNTTIELVLTGLVKDEQELKKLRLETVCGGISDATKERKEDLIIFDFVEEIACQLDINAKDLRIPLMVRGYFSDMYKVIRNIYKMMKVGAYFILDIGDSKFYDVYIPVEKILIKLANQVGFKLIEEEQIAKRYSRDKTELKQFVLTFIKE